MNPYSAAPRTITTDSQKTVESRIDLILSSVRPFGENEDYDVLQRTAINSWLIVAKTVVLFNMPEDTGNWQRPGLLYAGPDRNPPTIKFMLEYLKNRHEDEVVALVNSDIVLTPAIAKIPKVVSFNSLGRAWACTGFRNLLDRDTMKISPPIDKGLDFFCSTVRIWQDIARMIPGVLTIGRPVWDNWINSKFHTYIDRMKYFDLTPWGAILHCKHEEHFRLPVNEDGGIEAATKTIVHPGGLPHRKLKLLQ